MKSLITGGSGYIGSFLVPELRRFGHSVISIDSHSLDISERNAIRSLQRRLRGVDYVYHLAAKSSIGESQERPGYYHATNVTGTVNLLQACKHFPIKKFIYISSAEVYGIPLYSPTPETAPVNPNSVYGLTKYLGEFYTLRWSALYGIPVVILRLFNVYGPQSPVTGTWGPIITTFMEQKKTHVPYTVHGDGRERRDFVYVTDVVGAMIQACESRISGEIFNIGSGQAVSFNRVVKLLGGTKRSTKHTKRRDTWADISKAKRLLGWQPKVAIEEGLRNI